MAIPALPARPPFYDRHLQVHGCFVDNARSVQPQDPRNITLKCVSRWCGFRHNACKNTCSSWDSGGCQTFPPKVFFFLCSKVILYS